MRFPGKREDEVVREMGSLAGVRGCGGGRGWVGQSPLWTCVELVVEALTRGDLQ